MRVLLFGATGMIGRGTLLECLDDSRVTAVTAVGRSRTGLVHDKLKEVEHRDGFDYGAVAGALSGHDVCFYCIGVSAAGRSEADYRRVTVDLTLATAKAVLEANPAMVFCYISAAGADSSELGRIMWARVKGAIENRLFELPFRAVYVLRPGYIQPMRGVRSRTRLYRAAYAVASPVYPLLQRLFPAAVTTTVRLGRAMIELGRAGGAGGVLEAGDINALASRHPREE